MCGHKAETCISAPVKRTGTVQPSLFLPKFSLCFLASCRNQRVFKSSRLRSAAMKAPVGLLSDPKSTRYLAAKQIVAKKRENRYGTLFFDVPASFSSQKKGCCTGFYPCATALFVKTFFQNQLKNWSALS
jgi:hypothetical protein